MATYYGDLSVLSNPSYGVNDPNNPMGWTQIRTLGSVGAGHTLYLKGTRYEGSSDNAFNFTDLNVLPWDLNLYGPWRLNCVVMRASGGFSHNGSLDSGILTVTLFSAPGYATGASSIALKNCFLNTNRAEISGVTGITNYITLQGTTWKISTFENNVFDSKTRVVATDSILDFPSGPSTISQSLSTFTNCAFTSSDVWTSATKTNCQFNWTAPTWPSYNSNKEAFSASVLSAGINTPPEPGNSPYTGYNQGLFGTARKGIGGFHFVTNYFGGFDRASVADGTNANLVIDTEAQASKCAGDILLDSSAEIKQVHVYYTHELGRQKKLVKLDKPSFTTPVSWSPTYTLDGTWRKTRVKVFDNEGATHVFFRSDIGTSEDITHASGTMNLNAN